MKGGVKILLDVERELFKYKSAFFEKSGKRLEIKTGGIYYEKGTGINFC